VNAVGSELADRSIEEWGQPFTTNATVEEGPPHHWPLVVGWTALAGVAVFALANAQTGAGIRAAPGVIGQPRPSEFGIDNWPQIFEIVSLIVMAFMCVVYGVNFWRGRKPHPYFLMIGALTGIVCLDPVFNWVPYVSYDSSAWHWPETWAWASLSPTIEPVFAFLGYAYFYLLPTIPALVIYRRLAARRTADSFVCRHPMWTVFITASVIGFFWDAALEMFLVRIDLYIYAQVAPWGSVFAGTTHQFPLLWESVPTAFMMAAVAVLLYRDDSGAMTAERLARRLRTFSRRPFLSTMAVISAIMSIVYIGYGIPLYVIRVTNSASALAKPWPYADFKVYDPQGQWENQCQKGPFMPGIWSGWPTGQADRPSVTPDCSAR
jgi:hypothetical protein